MKTKTVILKMIIKYLLVNTRHEMSWIDGKDNYLKTFLEIFAVESKVFGWNGQ